MEDVAARGHFADLGAVVEGLHADDALRLFVLVDFFVVLAVVDDWDQFRVAID